MREKQTYNVIWFRNDLRVFDNYSIEKAFKENHPILAVYCFDPRHFETTKFGFKKTEKYRAQFLIETVQNLQKNLKDKLNISLLVFHDYPESVFPKLAEKYHFQQLFLQKEWTQEEVEIQKNVHYHLPEVEFIETYDQFLFHPEDIPYEFTTTSTRRIYRRTYDTSTKTKRFRFRGS